MLAVDDGAMPQSATILVIGKDAPGHLKVALACFNHP